jgi:hypothetical protein
VADLLPEALRVRLEDTFENPVPDTPVGWSVSHGELTEVSAYTGSDGAASARWILGRQTGEAEATARVEGGPEGSSLEVRFSALAEPPTLNLTVENLYVVQSTQRWSGDVPLVEGRRGLLRVFVRGSEATWHRPDVRVRIEDAGGEALMETLLQPPPTLRLGSDPVEEPLGQSYRFAMQEDLVRPGIRIIAQVDPEDRVPEADETDNVFPENGVGISPAVRAVAPFRVTFVPIRANGDLGNVEDGNTSLLLWRALDMFPLHEVDTRIREPLDLSEYDLRNAEDWGRFMAYVEVARKADGSDRYYFGVLPTVEGSAYRGMAIRGRPLAVGADEYPAIAAHEWGHNFGRGHAPCGDPPGPDEDYPYSEGSIGVYGFSTKNGSLQTPSGRYDIMSYCSPEWISDYTYEGILEFRAAEAAAAARLGPPPVPRESLLVWGRVGPDTLVLEPAFRARVPPALPDTHGGLRLLASDHAGGVLFDFSFDPDPLSGIPGAGVFAFAVPLEPGRRVATLRLTDGTRVTEVTRSVPPSGEKPRIERIDARRVRIRWNDDTYPLVVVRDAVTGTVLSFARGGSALVRVPPGDELEFIPSTGVDSRVGPGIPR